MTLPYTSNAGSRTGLVRFEHSGAFAPDAFNRQSSEVSASEQESIVLSAGELSTKHSQLVGEPDLLQDSPE